MSHKEALAYREPLVVSTVTADGKPHSNYVLSLGMVDNKILIGLCFLTTTFENLVGNQNICLTTCGKNGFFRIKGTIELFDSGKYFDLANSLSKPPMPKRALLVEIKEIFDLEKAVVVTL